MPKLSASQLFDETEIETDSQKLTEIFLGDLPDLSVCLSVLILKFCIEFNHICYLKEIFRQRRLVLSRFSYKRSDQISIMSCVQRTLHLRIDFVLGVQKMLPPLLHKYNCSLQKESTPVEMPELY